MDPFLQASASVVGCQFFRRANEQLFAGDLDGIGCGGLSRRRSVSLGAGCALIGILAGIVSEWRFAPFIEDKSFLFFLSHLHQLRSVSQILILVGGGLAFWFGLGRDRGLGG